MIIKFPKKVDQCNKNCHSSAPWNEIIKAWPWGLAISIASINLFRKCYYVILFRLQRTEQLEQILDEYRNELICIERECERELNLIKASLSSKPEAKILENQLSIINKQKHFIAKQKHIIDELRKTKFSQRSKL